MHTREVDGFKSLSELADAISNLRYDALHELLRHLAVNLYNDAKADEKRRRKKLASVLGKTADCLEDAAFQSLKAWEICEPYMKKDSKSSAEWVVLDPGKNSRFVCLRCGGHYQPDLPQEIWAMLALIDGFGKKHENCKPHPEGNICLHCDQRGHKDKDCSTLQYKTPEDWVKGTDTGLSSKTLWGVMMGGRGGFAINYPHDPADFGRCYRLLKLFPEWRQRILEMRHISGWELLAEHWDELEKLYEEELPTDRCPKLRERMKELQENVKKQE